MRTSMILLLSMALSLMVQPAKAGDAAGSPNCCARCGCHAACATKTCQVVCDIKKEVKTRWEVEYKEICPLLPGCHTDCNGCPPPPRCGHPKCIKALVKKEYTVETPVYKCVVKYLCPECSAGGSPQPLSAPVPPAANPVGPPAPPAAPLPPSPAAK